MLTLATFNLCNLGVDTPPGRWQRLAAIIAGQLAGPDILAVQEITATAAAPGQVPADATYRTLLTSIVEASGPHYAFREVPPLANQDGGLAGANIRNALLFNPLRVTFIDRGRSTAEDATAILRVNDHPILTFSPGRITPRDPAFAGDSHRHWVPSRKPLVGELRFQDKTLFCIVCHLKSGRGTTRREQDYAKRQRHAQASLIYRFAAQLLACNPASQVVIMGDMNDVPGSKTLKILKGDLFINLVENIPKGLRYTRRHADQPQALDHVLVSPYLRDRGLAHIPHVTSDSLDQDRASDHDPVLVTLDL
jgi:predicted extracellular nuclease